MVPKLDDKKRKTLEKELKNVKVETRHGKHSRHYRIAKLMKENAKQKKFEHNGAMMTVQKYFEGQYKMRLQFPELPLVMMLPREKNIYMPMECCYVLGGEHYKKKLTPEATADMVRSCARPAPERVKDINMYAANNKYSQDETITGFNIKVDPRMVQLEGRIMPARKVEYGNGKTQEPKRGVWEPKNQKAHLAAKVEDWGILCAEDSRYCGEQAITDFGQKIIRGGAVIGCKITRPVMNHYVRTLRELEKAFEEAVKKKLSFLVIILGRDSNFYNRAKQLGDIQHGMHSQCFKSANLRKANEQLIGNLWMKINAKLNGINNIVKNPENKNFLTKPTIIIGADVTHPAPGDNSKPSIAAMVCSMNATASKYVADVRIQNHRQEMIGSVKEGGKRNLEQATVGFLRKFYTATKGKKPEHIIYYRDGVAEGQFQEVLNTELKQLRTACSSLTSTYKPKMTIIICQKRHHTRLFVQNDRDGEGRSQNVPAGTVVDTVITHPTQFDFYMVSHTGIQGCSRPVKYHCIYNDAPGLNADTLQSLTYNLCHVYQRCARVVSLPAPVYYAHLAAKQAIVHTTIIEDDGSSTYSGDTDETFQPEAIQGLQAMATLHKEYANKSQHYI